MNEPDIHTYDLRNFKVGGWSSANLKTKVNGRWIYIYNPETNILINKPEPIQFEKKYVPPNHQREFYNTHKDNLNAQRTSPIRERPFTTSENSRAPLVYSSYSGVRPLIAPVVYGQFVKSNKSKLRNAQTANGSRIFPQKTHAKTEPLKLKKKAMSHSSVSPFVTKSADLRTNSYLFTNE